jgi:hypothetical protein
MDSGVTNRDGNGQYPTRSLTSSDMYSNNVNAERGIFSFNITIDFI